MGKTISGKPKFMGKKSMANIVGSDAGQGLQRVSFFKI